MHHTINPQSARLRDVTITRAFFIFVSLPLFQVVPIAILYYRYEKLIKSKNHQTEPQKKGGIIKPY